MRAVKIAAAAVFIILLAGCSIAYARPASLSLVMTGEVLSVGSQSYSVQGGQLVSGSVLGSSLNPWNSFLQYSLTASVSGLSATGSATFVLRTTVSHGLPEVVKGAIEIVGMTPAVSLPIGCTGSGCTGAIPALFDGEGLVTVSTGNSVQTLTLGMAFESPYLNPFGGPIFFESSGSQVVVIASYSQASIQWAKVQMGGTVSGSAGGESVTGNFGMVVNSSENLNTGTERDRGSIARRGRLVQRVLHDTSVDVYSVHRVPSGYLQSDRARVIWRLFSDHDERGNDIWTIHDPMERAGRGVREHRICYPD
jgi:hypothetical protein